MSRSRTPTSRSPQLCKITSINTTLFIFFPPVLQSKERNSNVLNQSEQADYILGKNPKSMSYLVGYGENYPVRVHHRGASIASLSVMHSSVGCVEGFEAWYKRPEADPNVIYGALVGGPNVNDEFTDDRSNYEQTEPTLSGAAPLVGLFSKLHSLPGNSAGKLD